MSPTLFGVCIYALESWLSHIQVSSRLLSSLIYADDLALVTNSPSHLQALICALSYICASAGLDVKATKFHQNQGDAVPPTALQSTPACAAFLLFWLRHSFFKYLSSILPTLKMSTSSFVAQVILRTMYMPTARHDMAGICWITMALLWLGLWQACSTAIATLYGDFDHVSQPCMPLCS